MLLLVLPLSGYCQQIPYIDSRELMLSGISANDSGYYKKAITYYSQIPEGDTNYEHAIYETMVSYTADSNYAEAKKYAFKGMSLPHYNHRDFLLMLGNIYDYLGKTDSALDCYNKLIKLGPYDNQPYYEKGILFYTKKKYDSAIVYLQQSLLINPYHFRSHYYLATIYLLQGRLTESLLALEGSLLITNNTELARGSINYAIRIAKETEDADSLYIEKPAKYSHPMFDKIDHVVNSKKALSRDYQLKTSIDEDVVRQMQIVMEKLEYDANDKNFVMQYYVPLLKKVRNEDQFENYILIMFSGYGIDEIEKLVEKRKDELEGVKKTVYGYLNHIRDTHILNYEEREKADEKYHPFENNILVVAKYKDKEGDQFAAGPVTMYKNYDLYITGSYDDSGKKTGAWKVYYLSGALKSEFNFKNGIEVGKTIEYSENGLIRKTTTYNDKGDKIDEVKYTDKGYPDYETKLISDNAKDYISYYNNGNKEYTLAMDSNENIKDGKYKTYYKNGTLKKEIEFKNGKLSGEYKEYYENGKLKTDGMLENGDKQGLTIEYYDNGNIKSKYNYVNNKEDGPFEEYFTNDTLSRKGTYKHGKLSGDEYYYTIYGKQYGTVTYKGNVPIAIKFTNREGATTYEKADDEGLYSYKTYYSNGNKHTSIKLNEKGKREGKITYYYFCGVKSSVYEYVNGKPDGAAVEYYRNGKISVEKSFKEGDLDGYYKKYFTNGVLKIEGWYKNGLKQGVWRYYNINGKISYETYYLDDKINSYTKNYNIHGEMDTKELYDDGLLTGLIQYDTNGKEEYRYEFPKGNGVYRLRNFDGKDNFVGNVKNGLLMGEYTKHYVNGKVSERGYYSFGYLDSSSTTYYVTGKEHRTGYYSYDNKEGKWTYYGIDGQVETEENHKGGDYEGEYKQYVGSNIRLKYNYAGGDQDGAQFIYGEDNKLAGVLYFEGGDLMGYSYEDKDGKLLPMVAVHNGTAKVNTFYANGNKALEWNYVNSYLDGQQLLYYSNGILAEEKNMQDQNYNGPLKKYYPNGKLAYEAYYKDDEEQGASVTYDSVGNILMKDEVYYGYINGPSQVRENGKQKFINSVYRYGRQKEMKK